ncbi:MAG: B12-binding domain-containing radical SAM protein [Planctomycetes bacterium]|nr:B12-binding domain-containing radical SAM protein [Planctomycetota bacterium]
MGISVTLVNLSVQPGESGKHAVPLGVLYLASSLIRRGIAFEIRNYEHCRDRQPFSAETFARFLDGSGDLIAVSLMSNMMPLLLAGLPRFKKERPDCRVVVGGFGPSADPERLLRVCPEIDFVVSGWGERALSDLVAALEGRTSLHTVAGLSFRGEDGVLGHVPRGELPPVDLLPMPAHRSVAAEDRHDNLPVVTARGCPHRCAFCDIPGYHRRRTAYRDLGKVLDEIEEFHGLYREDARKRTGVTREPAIGIVDDTFCSRRDRVLRFCDELGKRGKKVSWWVSARVNELDAELLERMAEAGCESIFIGVESGSDSVLRAIDKGFDSARAIAAVKMAAQRISVITASFIWGLPMESPQDFRQTLLAMTLCRAAGVQVQAHLWSPLPRSRLYREYRQCLAFSQRFISDIAFAPEALVGEHESLIRAHPELYSCFYHYPHPDLEERLAMLRQMRFEESK